MKKLCSILLLLTMLFGLCGCGDSADIPSDDVVGALPGESAPAESTPDESTPDESGQEQPADLASVWRQFRRGGYQDGEWSSWLEYERNEYGLYTAILVMQDGEQAGDNAIVSYEYDDQGRLTVQDCDYRKFQFDYGEDGNLISVLTKDKKGNTIHKLTYAEQDGARYHVISDTYDWYYDEYFRCISETYTANKVEYRSEFIYDDNGNLVKEIGYRNSELWYIDEFTYNASGYLLAETGLEFGDSLPAEGELYKSYTFSEDEYDEQGRCMYWYDNNGEKLPSNPQWSYEYDAQGRLIRETSSNGAFNEFDENGNIVVHYSTDEVFVFAYKEYPILNDELLIAFYNLQGDAYV